MCDASPARQWIVRHALRDLVKKGDRGALEVLGVAAAPAIEVRLVAHKPVPLRIGEVLKFEAELKSTTVEPQTLLVDFAVHFVKANGGTRPKVFKLRKLDLGRDAQVLLAGNASFASLTTRRPYPGTHRLELVVNGVLFPLTSLEVGD